MKLPPVIIEMLSRRADHELRLPSDCVYLSLDIEGKTGTHIGATTLKRLLGFAADDRTPHPSTLDIPRSVHLIGDFVFGPGGGKIVVL